MWSVKLIEPARFLQELYSTLDTSGFVNLVWTHATVFGSDFSNDYHDKCCLRDLSLSLRVPGLAQSTSSEASERFGWPSSLSWLSTSFSRKASTAANRLLQHNRSSPRPARRSALRSRSWQLHILATGSRRPGVPWQEPDLLSQTRLAQHPKSFRRLSSGGRQGPQLSLPCASCPHRRAARRSCSPVR